MAASTDGEPLDVLLEGVELDDGAEAWRVVLIHNLRGDRQTRRVFEAVIVSNRTSEVIGRKVLDVIEPWPIP